MARNEAFRPVRSPAITIILKCMGSKAKEKEWKEAKKRHRLSEAQVRMARELGMAPKSLRKLDNHRQEPWKLPLREFIESQYEKRFGKVLGRSPDAARGDARRSHERASVSDDTARRPLPLESEPWVRPFGPEDLEPWVRPPRPATDPRSSGWTPGKKNPPAEPIGEVPF